MAETYEEWRELNKGLLTDDFMKVEAERFENFCYASWAEDR